MINRIKECFNEDEIKYALYAKNLDNGEVIAINEEKIVTSASVIKLFIMGEAYNQVSKGVLSIHQRIRAKDYNRVPFSIVTMLSEDNSYTIRDLIVLMIVQSDNTATNILIDILGMENINTFIKGLGLYGTSLKRKMMDSDARKRGLENKLTALDVGRFLELLYKGEIVNKDSSLDMINIMKQQLDYSKFRVFIPDDIEIAHKTGELENLDHDVGIIFGDKCNYILVVLTWEAINNNYARLKVAEASKAIHDYFS